MKIILASASPRRQELLKAIFPEFTIQTSGCEETAVFHSPSQYVKALSMQKAKAVADRLMEQNILNPVPSPIPEAFLILGADTIVYHSDTLLGKPQNESDAFAMLQSLSGDSHEVYTGVTVYAVNFHPADATSLPRSASFAPAALVSFAEKTIVHVDALTDDEISSYIATADPMDKAGSYGIQGPFGKHITGIDGDYFNVVGLPVSRLYRELKAHHLIP